MIPLYTQVMYKGVVGEIVDSQDGFDYSSDGYMYWIELEDNRIAILKPGEFTIVENRGNTPVFFMGMTWGEIVKE